MVAGKATVNTGPLPMMFPTTTLTGPVVAELGTRAWIWVSLQLVINIAATPLKFTVDVPRVAPNPEPLMVTGEPGPPESGDKPVMLGFGSAAPSVIETLSIVAVPSAVPPNVDPTRPI